MSQGGLRQRSAAAITTNSNESPSVGNARRQAGTLQSMQGASPQQTGTVQKLHVSSFYSILPSFLQMLIAKVWFLTFLRPYWEERQLVLLGSYLYKFVGGKQQPKGTPVPVDSMDVFLVINNNNNKDDNIARMSNNLPAGYTTMFCVSTLRKKYYYACTSREQALTWVNSLHEARQEAVRRSMGHAVKDSYPKSWLYFDSLGNSLVQQKYRIENRLQESSLRELEMSNLTEGGPVPRGYFG